jgi:F-type H+-transporting ATPase subunit delta
MIENPKIAYDLKAKLVSEKLSGINPLALNLAYLLAAKGKTKIAGDIAKDYTRLMNDHRGIKHAEVITAVAIDEEGKKRLSDQLGNLVGMKVSVEVKTDPDIMGGIIARIDDALIDGSIRNRLELLKKDLRGRG